MQARPVYVRPAPLAVIFTALATLAVLIAAGRDLTRIGALEDARPVASSKPAGATPAEDRSPSRPGAPDESPPAPASPMPDLAVRCIVKSEDIHPHVIPFQGQIQNLGDIRFGHFGLDFLANGRVFSSFGMQGLEPGERSVVNMGHHVTDEDRQRGWAEIGLRIRPGSPDGDATNNVYTFRVEVPQPEVRPIRPLAPPPARSRR